MKLFTQVQAVAKYGKRYSDYDPMTLLVGTRKEFLKSVFKQVQIIAVVDGKPTILGSTIESAENHEMDLGDLRLSLSLDYESKTECRLVIWK